MGKRVTRKSRIYHANIGLEIKNSRKRYESPHELSSSGGYRGAWAPSCALGAVEPPNLYKANSAPQYPELQILIIVSEIMD